MTDKKSDITRKRILDAATKVFARESYHSASIRMIAKEGAFDHGIIRYYYTSKALLFTAVIEKICGEILEATSHWFDRLDIDPEKGFSTYLDRFLAYSFENPYAFRMVMQNITQDDKKEQLPGYNQMIEIIAISRKIFEEKISMTANSEDISMFISCFSTIIFNYIGSSSSQAKLLNMEPDTPEYRKWVKDTLIFMFLPRLIHLIGL